MNNSNERLPELSGNSNRANSLSQYLQSLDTQTAFGLSQPSPDATQIMEHHLIEMLGSLPERGFIVTISTTREHLSLLLASAMMSGYFIRRAEERMELEKHLAAFDMADGVHSS